MIVISTELVVALYVEDSLTEAAEAVFRKDPEWATPLLWRTLFPHNVIDKLRGGRSHADVLRAMVDSAPRLFRGREFPAPLKDNVEILLRSECSALIAPFLSLALALSVPLVTTDALAIRDFPDAAMSPSDFLKHKPGCPL